MFPTYYSPRCLQQDRKKLQQCTKSHTKTPAKKLKKPCGEPPTDHLSGHLQKQSRTPHTKPDTQHQLLEVIQGLPTGDTKTHTELNTNCRETYTGPHKTLQQPTWANIIATVWFLSATHLGAYSRTERKTVTVYEITYKITHQTTEKGHVATHLPTAYQATYKTI